MPGSRVRPATAISASPSTSTTTKTTSTILSALSQAREANPDNRNRQDGLHDASPDSAGNRCPSFEHLFGIGGATPPESASEPRSQGHRALRVKRAIRPAAAPTPQEVHAVPAERYLGTRPLTLQALAVNERPPSGIPAKNASRTASVNSARATSSSAATNAA